MSEEMLSIGEAARLMNVCENTLREWDNVGSFPASRSTGSHRRYSLDQVRLYVEKHPQVKDFKNEYDSKKGEYYNIKKALTINAENYFITYESTVGNPNMVLSKEQFVWLTNETWERSKLRKMINVQPMINSCGYVFYRLKTVIESSLVAYWEKRINVCFFKNVDFELIKNVYADALAAVVDQDISKHLPRIDLNSLKEIAKYDCQDMKKLYDYIAAPLEYVESFKLISSMKNVELITIQDLLDPETFDHIGIGGFYPNNRYDLPIYCPHLLFSWDLLPHNLVVPLKYKVTWFDKN